MSTSVIEIPHSGARLRARKVLPGRDDEMVLGRAAAPLRMAENNLRKIMGYRNLRMVKAALGRKEVLFHQEVA